VRALAANRRPHAWNDRRELSVAMAVRVGVGAGGSAKLEAQVLTTMSPEEIQREYEEALAESATVA
jgi:hypothetical protein